MKNKDEVGMFRLNDDNNKLYKLIGTSEIKEQNLIIYEFVHNASYAHILLFETCDENKVFNIAFKTPVMNSKGIPHILEHSVLCGSKKYNVKDPFIELAKSSLNTFLNAMTFPDKTCYPVASANTKDFHNLVSVYLDAVFFPNAVKDDRIFKQEGWHYEIADKDSELKVNGVVYNEMRGVYQDPDSLLETEIMNTLFKGTCYEYESGGDPKEIINLTYDEFVDFHKKYYSPSNSVIYYYGNLDFNEELTFLHREYLSHFGGCECQAITFANAERTDKTFIRKVAEYNIDDEDDEKDKCYFAYSFALDSKKETLKNIVLQIIDYALFSSDSAILKEKLMNEGFGEAVFSNCETGLKNGFFSIISQNIAYEKLDDFIKIVDDSINEILDKGIDKDKLLAGINSLYFDYAEDEWNGYPRGLYFSLVSLDTYLYGEDVGTFLKYKDAFDYLKNVDFEDKNNIFIKTLKEVFTENNHKCINVLKPKKGFLVLNDEKTKEILKNRKSKMTEKEIEDIIKTTKDLKEYQEKENTKEELSVVPMLHIEDLDKYKKLIDYKVDINNGIKTIWTFDNKKDIIYMSISFDVTGFSDEEIYMLSIINNIISKMDLKDISFYDFNNFVDVNTGGLGIKIEAFEKTALWTLSLKVIKDKVDVAFDVLYKLLTGTVFCDKNRINLLVNEVKANAINSILSKGHIATMVRARSKEMFASAVMDKVDISGVGFNKFINKFSANYLDNAELINDVLTRLFNKILQSGMYMTCSINQQYKDSYLVEFNKFIDKLKRDIKNVETSSSDALLKIFDFEAFAKKEKSEAIVTSNDVNFCAVAGSFNKEKYEGRLNLLRTIFNYEYLWTNIRVLGGAYGCMSNFTKNGFYAFASYRDPNFIKTNEVFMGVKEFLENFVKSDDEIEKYIIGTMGSYDNPMSVLNIHKRNVAAYFNDVDNDFMNKERQNIMATTSKDIKALAGLFADIQNSNKCAIINKNCEDIARANYDVVFKLG